MVRKHPTLQQLQDFLNGAEGESTVIEKHLNQCTNCQTLLAENVVHDELSDLAAAGLHRLETDSGESYLQIPQLLRDHSRYKLLKPLGRGGMGVVWLAEHVLMNRKVAIKLIRPELLSRPEAIEHFRREMRSAAKLHHPNIASAYDAEQVDREHFFVMEYLEGETLREVMSRGPMPVTEACRIIRDVALGLDHAHSAGLIHRDIKPGNLMINRDGNVKILDFGLVNAVKSDFYEHFDDSNLLSPSVAGTPSYMAPEQIRDAGRADARSDIYSLGRTFYSLLTGNVPPQSCKPLPNVPTAINALISRMTAVNPQERFSSAKDVALALEPFCKPKSRWPMKAWLIAAGFAALLLLAAVIYRIETDRGELIIETEDPDVEVVIRQSGKVVSVIDLKTQKKVTLKSGIYELEANGEGLKLDADHATLSRGDTVIARITKSAGTGKLIPEIMKLPEITEVVYAVVFSPDGKLAAVAGGDTFNGKDWLKGKDYTIRIYEIPSGKILHRLSGHTDRVYGLAFSPDQTKLASSSIDNTVKIWDLASNNLLHSIRVSESPTTNSDMIGGLIYSMDGKRILTTTEAIKILDSETGALLPSPGGEFDIQRNRNNWVRIPGTEKLISSGWYYAKLIDEKTGKMITNFDLPGNHRFRAIDASSTQTLGFDAFDGSTQSAHVRIWDNATGKIAWSHSGVTCGLVNEHEVLFRDVDEDTIKLWDIKADKLIRTFAGQPHFLLIAVQPGGSYFITGGVDGTARLWKLPDRK